MKVHVQSANDAVSGICTSHTGLVLFHKRAEMIQFVVDLTIVHVNLLLCLIRRTAGLAHVCIRFS